MMRKLQRVLFIATVVLLAGLLTAKSQTSNKVLWWQMADNKNASFYDVQSNFYKVWKNKIKEKEKESRERGTKKAEHEDGGYEIFKRWETFMAPRVYPSGNMTLPSTTFENYISWLNANQSNSTSTQSPGSASRVLSTGNWTALGPIGSPSGPSPYSRTGAGRINFVRFDPLNNAIMYVGAPDGGLWKSTNNGNSWTTNTDFLTIIGCADLAINPILPGNMFLASGDIETDRNSIGILKTLDGGTTWSTTALTFTPSSNIRIAKLLMNPSNPLNMIAVTTNGIYRTTDGWTTSTQTQATESFKDAKLNPGNANVVYAAGTTLWRSTDNGVTWNQVTTGLPVADVSRIALGVSPGNASYVYALIGKADNSYKGMYRSNDNGASFTLRSSTPNLLGYETNGSDVTAGQAFYDLCMTVSPTNAEIITTGGINHWQSPDGGLTWVNKSYWAAGQIHADIHELDYLPGSSTTIFSCNDGGLFRSTDNGTNWTDLSNNLAISQVVGIGLSGGLATTIVNGEQDNGTNLKTGSTWTNINGGDGGKCFIDYTNDQTIYIQYIQGAFARSDDGGASNNAIVAGLPTGFEFYSPWKMDPVTPAKLYTGGIPTLYVSNNKGTNWSALGTPAGTGNIVEFAIAPSNTQVIYVVKQDAVAKSIDGGATFTNVTGTLPVTSAALTNVAVANNNPNKVWVTFSGYSAGNKVFKSIDGGATWTNVSTGLPNLPANVVIATNGSASDAIYVGSDIGVYYLDNNLAGFAPFMTNLPNVSVRDLKIFYPTSKLRAATYGRGVWESDLYTTAPVPVQLTQFTGLNKRTFNQLNWTISQDRTIDHFEIEKSKDGMTFQNITSVAANPSTTGTSDYQYNDVTALKGANYYRLKIIDIDGTYKYSNIITINNSGTTTAINVYPNPFTDELVIERPGTGEVVKFEIINAAGQTVRKGNFESKVTLTTSQLAPGTYFIKLNNDEAYEFKKVIKK